jgi:hypothetical protein
MDKERAQRAKGCEFYPAAKRPIFRRHTNSSRQTLHGHPELRDITRNRFSSRACVTRDEDLVVLLQYLRRRVDDERCAAGKAALVTVVLMERIA